MKLNKRKLWLSLPFLITLAIDAAVTLAGQPAEYWNGLRSAANEAFPVFSWGLTTGPWMFIVLVLLWFAIFSIIIMVTPNIISSILSLSLVNGHTWGAMTWFVYSIKIDYHICLLYFLFTSTLFIVSYNKWKR